VLAAGGERRAEVVLQPGGAGIEVARGEDEVVGNCHG
jgi:hypothetical protein